ncbi:MAG: dUTP diphosphatase [Candidatus Cryptobacteroides sp.]
MDFLDYFEKYATKINVALDAGAIAPTRAHDEDGGLDLYMPQNHAPVVLRRGESLTIDTGVHMEIPRGYVGLIAAKSGLNVNFGITSNGVVDSGYTGSIRVKLFNHGQMHHGFEGGNKISQILILPVMLCGVNVVDKINGGERGDNGFGSTGR